MNQRECLMSLWSVMNWAYKKGNRIAVQQIRNFLKWIQNFVGTTGRMACCPLRLSKFKIGVVHRIGIGLLSCIPSEGVDETLIVEEIPVAVTAGTSNPEGQVLSRSIFCKAITCVVEERVGFRRG